MSTSVVAFLVLSAAAMSAAQPGGYPVEAAWSEHQQFCGAADPTAVGWAKFSFEPDSTLDYLTGPSPLSRPDAQNPAPPVFRKIVAGREVFAFKRVLGASQQAQCRSYDFAASQRLDSGRWSAVIGQPLDEQSGPTFQRLDWRKKGPVGANGMVELRLNGHLTNPDDVGFNGLNLVTVLERPR